MKYSFIIPYYNRYAQFKRTLLSFAELYYDRHDFELVVIEDNKQTSEMSAQLARLLDAYSNINPHVNVICNAMEDCYNPATAYNLGASKAKGQYIILTSPECMHENNILAGLDAELAINPHVYIVCACRADHPKHNNWYQHSVYRNQQYHFCSILSKHNYNMIGGFDERYSMGYGYDDDSFRDRVYNKNIPVVVRDNLVVYHQPHNKERPKDYKYRHERNRQLYLSDK